MLSTILSKIARRETEGEGERNSQFQRGPISNLVVSESNVIFENGMPLLQFDLLGGVAGLSGEKLLEIAYSVIGFTLNPDLLPKSVVARKEKSNDVSGIIK